METLLSGSHDNLDQLHKQLDNFCDSVVLNQSPSHIKAHVHTTDLMRCTDLLKNYGTIIHQKIDDIKEQWAINEHRKHKVAIVTDSSADIPEDIRTAAQVHTIPIQVRLGEHALLDRLTINLDTLFDQTSQHQLKTSTAAPTAAIVNRYLHFLASHYDSIIVITLSSRLSSTYQLVKNQAEQINGTKIDVIDSLSLAAGTGLLVMKAAKLLDEGCDHDTAVKALNETRNNIRIYVAIDELKTMRESGRLSKIMHKIADWGHVKPILSIDSLGQISIAGVSLGKQKSWKKLSPEIQRRSSPESCSVASACATVATIPPPPSEPCGVCWSWTRLRDWGSASRCRLSSSTPSSGPTFSPRRRTRRCGRRC
jgi:DegV family protein with EDD domain